MKKSWIIVLAGLLFCNAVLAQFTRYVVQLRDKNHSGFSVSDPSKFLSQRAIDRRNRYNIAISSTDLPVNQTYIDAIAAAGNVTILNVSKWFNQVCISTTDTAALTAIHNLPFVATASAVAPRPPRVKTGNKFNKPPVTTTAAARPLNPANTYDYGLAFSQVHMHNAEFLHNLGFRGDNMRLAIMDAGFQNYLRLPTFDSIRTNNQILDTWDFVSNDSDVNSDHFHGMNCLSTIAANMPGTFLGTAPKAGFYLFRSEDAASEYPVELQNFVAAAERADSAGADVFSVSLGYNNFDENSFDFSYADMNGHTTLITKAVNMAAQKGIAVVVAAGNEGNSSWHYITTPGDADSALTVGAVNANRQAGSFSSYGPSSSGRVKPDVAAIGAGAVVASSSTGLPVYGNGTSYACPIMAGITTCLWQAFPEVTNMEIFDALRKSADRFANPDDRTGYGIPDVKKAFVNLQKQLYSGKILPDNNCKVNLTWSVKTAANMSCVVERKLSTEAGYKIIDSQAVNRKFNKFDFAFSDDLATINPGTSISYRIRMDIGTDTSFYLDSATINYLQACNTNGPEAIIISPNPATDQLSVKVTRSTQGKIDIVLFNALGQELSQSAYHAVAGQQTFTIPLKQFSNGLYHIRVFADGKVEKAKSFLKE